MSTAVRTQWVFRYACGCPFGVLDGSCAETEFDAWDDFYDQRVGKVRAARRAGVTVEHMSHERYSAEVCPQMRTDYQCPHGEVTQ
jgi:hypothetical protein